MIVLVVTATPNDLSNGATSQAISTTPPPPPTATPTLTPLPPTATSSAPTATIDPCRMPTPTVGQIQVAEQVFERGRMFWIQPRLQIWVMVDTGNRQGQWMIYQDTFAEGEPENDPNLIPPSGKYQPSRGFGKLWRQTPVVRDALGWGLTPEFGYGSNYEYHPENGRLNEQGVCIPGAGSYHVLFSLAQEKFRFNEGVGTWKKE
jgi:hypothetical protein